MGTSAQWRIRPARPSEAELLSDLAWRSKAYWGYSQDFMEACREELSFDAQYVRTNPTWVIETGSTVLGFYALEWLSDDDVELGYLFMKQETIGQGYGKALIEHAKQKARELGYERMIIQADPHAERFYRTAGGVVQGSKTSASLPGRELPVLHIDLTA